MKKESRGIQRGYVAVLVGIALYVVLDVVVQFLPPHYSPISQAESDLAVGPYGYIMTINFLNRGLLSLAFIFAFIGTIHLTAEKTAKYRSGLTLLGIWSVGALLLAVFPTDVPATPVSWHGAIHLVVAIVAFLTGAFGALVLSMEMGGNGVLRNLRRYALPTAVLVVIFCLIDLLASIFAHRVNAHFGGLFERLFLGSMLAWITAVSVYLLKHQSKLAAPAALSDDAVNTTKS
jgi:hypothetical protein